MPAAASAATASAPASKKAEPIVEDVVMTDGRVVPFSGKRQMVKESWVKEGRIFVRIDFRDGTIASWTTADPGMILRLACHGGEQKFGDEAAKTDLVKVEDKYEAIASLMARMSDESQTIEQRWTQRSDSKGFSGASVLLEALCRQHPTKTRDQLRAFLGTKTDIQKKALRASDRYAPVVALIEAERAAKKGPQEPVDVSALEDELESLADEPAAA